MIIQFMIDYAWIPFLVTFQAWLVAMYKWIYWRNRAWGAEQTNRYLEEEVLSELYPHKYKHKRKS